MQDVDWSGVSRTCGERVALIVEHDAWRRWTLAELFDELGFVVVGASNGGTGLRLATALRPNVVVLGEELPELTAGQLADELRTLHYASPLLVVLAGELPWGPITSGLASRARARVTGIAQELHQPRHQQLGFHQCTRTLRRKLARNSKQPQEQWQTGSLAHYVQRARQGQSGSLTGSGSTQADHA